MSWGPHSDPRIVQSVESDGEVTVKPNWPVVALGFIGLTTALVWLGALLGRSSS